MFEESPTPTSRRLSQLPMPTSACYYKKPKFRFPYFEAPEVLRALVSWNTDRSIQRVRKQYWPRIDGPCSSCSVSPSVLMASHLGIDVQRNHRPRLRPDRCFDFR